MFISSSQIFVYIKIGITCFFEYLLCSCECKVLIKMKISHKEAYGIGLIDNPPKRKKNHSGYQASS